MTPAEEVLTAVVELDEKDPGHEKLAPDASLVQRAAMAVEIILRYGGFDGEHHKTWTMNEALRALLGPDGYGEIVRIYTEPDDGDEWDEGSEWDEGTPP